MPGYILLYDGTVTEKTSLSLLESMSRAEARRLGAATVRTSHVLLALAGHEQFQAHSLLNDAGIDQDKVRSRMKTGKNPGGKSDIPLSKEVRRLFAMAQSQALALGQEALADLHVVWILMSDKAFAKDPARNILIDCLAASFCRNISATLAGLDISSRVGSRQESPVAKPSVYSVFDEDARAVVADRQYITLDGLRSYLLGEGDLELVVQAKEIPEANDSLIAVPVTGRLLSTLHTAREDARAMGHALVTEVHVAMSLLLDAKERNVLTDGDRGDLIFADLLDLLSGPRVCEIEPEFSPDLGDLFQRACSFVPADHGGALDINHIAMALSNPKIIDIMTRHGLTPAVVRRRMQWCLDWTLRFMPDAIKAADTISMSDFSASLAAALKPLEKEEAPLFRFFGPRTETLLDFALKEAQDQGDDYVGIDHLFVGILSGYSGQAGKIFEEEGVDVCLARECLGESRLRGKGRKTPTLLPSVAVSRLMRIALDLCRAYGFRFIEPEHIAYALACEHEGLSLRIFDGLNIDGARVANRLESVLSR